MPFWTIMSVHVLPLNLLLPLVFSNPFPVPTLVNIHLPKFLSCQAPQNPHIMGKRRCKGLAFQNVDGARNEWTTAMWGRLLQC